MMHFFRRSKIHLDCFTHRVEVIEYAPVVNAINAIPQWWKDLPKSTFDLKDGFTPRPTMKTCVGMIDYYHKSVAMPLWSDLAIEVRAKDNFYWQFSDNITNIDLHSSQQYANAPFINTNAQIKIESPWLFKTKENIDWILTDPIYNHERFNDYTVAQGLLNFSKQFGTSIQLLLDTSTTRKYVIPFGSTFMFTPLSDKKVVVHRHLITKQEFDKEMFRIGAGIKFLNKHRTQQKITKCPYKDKT